MNQKLENILNLALDTSEEQRAQTGTLNVGFDSAERSWELIIKYHGSLEILEQWQIRVEVLIAGYAILTVPERLVDAVAELEQVEYVEKPKRFYYEQTLPTDDDCVSLVSLREPFLTGAGVLVAILDSGIDYRRLDFRKADGSTRIRFLWDQTLRAPEGEASYGVVFDERQINAALAAETEAEQYELLPSRDVSGHGTAVAGIAAGYARRDDPFGEAYSGIAPQADLLVVKLGIPGELGFPRTTEIMRGVTFALQKAQELEMPLVINLSFGNSYGPHDGSSLLERFLDNA